MPFGWERLGKPIDLSALLAIMIATASAWINLSSSISALNKTVYAFQGQIFQWNNLCLWVYAIFNHTFTLSESEYKWLPIQQPWSCIHHQYALHFPCTPTPSAKWNMVICSERFLYSCMMLKLVNTNVSFVKQIWPTITGQIYFLVITSSLIIT